MNLIAQIKYLHYCITMMIISFTSCSSKLIYLDRTNDDKTLIHRSCEDSTLYIYFEKDEFVKYIEKQNCNISQKRKLAELLLKNNVMDLDSIINNLELSKDDECNLYFLTKKFKHNQMEKGNIYIWDSVRNKNVKRIHRKSYYHRHRIMRVDYFYEGLCFDRIRYFFIDIDRK